MIEIQKKDGSVGEMELNEFSRWMCLAEAFFFIEEKAKELNVNVEKLLKPLAIEQYIKDRYEAMKHDVQVEIRLGKL